MSESAVRIDCDLSVEHRMLVKKFTGYVNTMSKGEDVRGRVRICVFNSRHAFAHAYKRNVHEYVISPSGLDSISDGKEKRIEYSHLVYTLEDLQIDTTNTYQVLKQQAIHETAHVIESEFGTGDFPSQHKEDFETILIDLLDKYWSVL